MDRSLHFTAPNSKLNQSVVEPKTSGTLRNKKLLVVPRATDPNGSMSLDLTSNGYMSLQASAVADSTQGKSSVTRMVSKVKQKHKPSESIFDSGRIQVSVEPHTGKSLDKYLNSELVRRSQLSTKLSRQANTDREDDIVIVGVDEAYKEQKQHRYQQKA